MVCMRVLVNSLFTENPSMWSWITPSFHDGCVTPTLTVALKIVKPRGQMGQELDRAIPVGPDRTMTLGRSPPSGPMPARHRPGQARFFRRAVLESK
jgi:hypothetical protein